MKRRVRLTEGDLHRIVRESVKRVLKEGFFQDSPQTIADVRNSLIKDIEDSYSQQDLAFIDNRLREIMKEYRLTLEDLDYYCSANSSEMFHVIFDYADLNPVKFKVY